MIDTEALRKKVIDLAIRGKLTEQLPEDGTAEELYAQIQEEKVRLINDGKIKKQKLLPSIEAEEIPFEIPKNWKWVRLGGISSIISKGTTPREGKVAYLNSGVGFLRVDNLSGFDSLNLLSLKYIAEETHNNFLKRSKLENGDVLISIAGTLGKTGLVRESNLPLNANQAIAFIRIAEKAMAIREYIIYVLNSSIIQKILSVKKVDMAIPNLSLEVISKVIIPFPPLDEQIRIVDKIHTAFQQIDNIDTLQSQYCNNLESLKSKIIDAGIRGKLTEQLLMDGTAEELYAQIQEEKAKLVKAGKIKKQKPLPAIAADEIPFEIPKNWKWVRFADIIDVRDGTHDSPQYHEDGIPMITSKNLSSGALDFDNAKYVSKSDAKKINERSAVDDGDILFAMIGTIGNPVLIKKDREFVVKNVALFKRYKVLPLSRTILIW